MERPLILKENNSYSSTELKLSALLLAEIPGATVEVYPQENSSKKLIKVFFSPEYQIDVAKLEHDFINKEALANIYRYNKALNVIRDKTRLG